MGDRFQNISKDKIVLDIGFIIFFNPGFLTDGFIMLKV